ncbi:MAG: hypothetical protein COU27_00455 [Candidatus Levybacteria bacterium CG10_big_fil_rev_8_21_14_0_10_36_7]|nr:MAG: hypothetical protein COU27_00455 [Candidatus Levybacteria bacterium CG10_big_fil_rev_8_21_14_0_10_36_7]
MAKSIDDFLTFSDSHASSFLRTKTYSSRFKDPSPDELNEILKYLKNPTETGIWRLRIEWKSVSGISEDIFNSVIVKKKNKKKVSIEEKIKDVVKRISFIYCFFTYLYYQEKKDTSFSEYLKYEHSSEYQIINDIKDLEKIKKRYIDAYVFFKKNIFIEGFNPWQDNEIKFVKKGFYILPGSIWNQRTNPWNRFYLEENNVVVADLFSSKAEVLEDISEFFIKIEKIKNENLTRIFSPEEEVFAPYADFLSATHEKIIKDRNISRRFSEATSELSDDNFSHCINIISVVAEDILVRVYENVYREVCPKNLGLGQLQDTIARKANKLLKKENSKPDNQEVLKEINKLNGRKKLNSEVLKLIRSLALNMEKNTDYLERVIDSEVRKSDEIKLFPAYLKDCLNELTRYRNSTSHKSRVPIGEYEALRALYATFYLYQWWIDERSRLDWKKSKEEILIDLITEN